MGRTPTCTCGECPKCKQRVYKREWYRAHAEQVRETVRRYRKKNIERIRAYDRARGFRETDPVKIRARNATRQLGKGTHPCEVCGTTPADAHHEDYSKPLEVRWLCETHHYALHRTF